MFHKISSAELISYLAERSASDKVSIEIKNIRHLGHQLETESPSVVFDGDKYSIESFRCLCSHEIKVSSTTITFDRSHVKIRQIVTRYQPSYDIIKVLDKIKNK